MSWTIGDLRPSEPAPEEAALGEYHLAYSELESSLRRVVVWAFRISGQDADLRERTRSMVEALLNEMNFYEMEKAIGVVIEVRAQTLDEKTRVELQGEWRKLRKRCTEERERRNRFAHSSVRIEEDLGGRISVGGREPKTYSAEELRERIKRVRDLTWDMEEFASGILQLPLE